MVTDPKKELKEKDFIDESYSKNPYPLWLWLFVTLTITLFSLFAVKCYVNFLGKKAKNTPFLKVTNRQMSLFLWQNPQMMRAHVKRKVGYLPGFASENKVAIKQGAAEEYVVAPPNLLFLYHTWQRHLSKEIPKRSIAKEEFEQFLQDLPEWKGENWSSAPASYIALLSHKLPEDLTNVLPYEVQVAFQGWKNYFKEGAAINAEKITYDDVKMFLRKYPHYARPYWKNLVGENYLKGLHSSNNGEQALFKEELTPFLRVAIFNEKMSTHPK